jgi:hypothetical protein
MIEQTDKLIVGEQKPIGAYASNLELSRKSSFSFRQSNSN